MLLQLTKLLRLPFRLQSWLGSRWNQCVRLVRATHWLSWSPARWKSDLARWLKTSSPETYAWLLQEQLLDAHLQRLVTNAWQHYRELRHRGVSWRQARRQVEQALATQIGKIAWEPPPSLALPAAERVPDELSDWLPELEEALRHAAPEGYAVAQQRGLLQPHLENVLLWAQEQYQQWPPAERQNSERRRQLFEQARQRAACIAWDTPILRRDPQRWGEDIVRYWRWVSPERADQLQAVGQLHSQADRIAHQLQRAWRLWADGATSLRQWLAFARAGLLWSQHSWHDLLRCHQFTSLTVDIVGSCNARCPFCPRVAMPPERAKGFMDFELFRRILQKGRARGVRTLYLYSTGEPTLHPRFDDFVALAKDLGYFVVCSTNGSMMQQHQRGLCLADVVQLSIEGWDRVSYERYRYPLRFDRVYGNVQEYAAIRPAQQRYVLNCLLTRKTDIEQYALLWGQFFDEIAFHPMYPTAGVLDGKHRAIPETTLAEDYWWFEPALLPTCSDPFEKLTIAFDGKRVLCCQDFSASLPLGHADDDWDVLYRNPIVQRVRRELLQQSFETCDHCGNLVELPAAVKSAFLAEIRRVWQTYSLRAQPRTFSLELHTPDPDVAVWLRRIARSATAEWLSEIPSPTPQSDSCIPVRQDSPQRNAIALTVLEATEDGHQPLDMASQENALLRHTGERASEERHERWPVLVLVGEVAEFTALARLAQRLAQATQWQPLLYFTEPYPQMTKHLLRCRQMQLPVWAGWRVLKALPQPCLFDNSGCCDVEPVPLDAEQRDLLDWCRSLAIPEFEPHLEMLRREQAFFCRTLDQLQPRVLILGQENISKFTPIYSRSAQQRGIGSVIVPWCLASREEFEQALSAIPLYDGTTPVARTFCARFPHWRLSENRALLRAPVYEAAALEILRCAPQDPWAFQSGFAAALAAESPWMVQHYLRQGVPQHWIRLTGSWCDDDLHEGLRYWQQKRQQLCRELHLDPQRPLLLAALPSDQMRSRGNYTEFQSYAELLTYWADTLAAIPNCQAVLVAHPSTSPACWRHLERQNVRLSDRPTYELMPLADALVACVSSIIRWALACGLPVVDYDVYRFGYTYFLQEQHVQTVQTRQEFVRALQNLVGRLRPGQHVPPDGVRISDWGLLDGQSLNRINDLLHEVAGVTMQAHPLPAAA